MENKKSSVLLTVIGVATLLVAIVGASFAYFSASSKTVNQSVGTGALKISAMAGAVNQANIKPVNASEITTVEAKMGHADVVKLPVTVNSTGTTIKSQYNIFLTTTGVKLNTEAGEGGSLSDIKWELVKDGEVKYSGDFTNVGPTLHKMPLNVDNQGTILPIAVPSQAGENDTVIYGASEEYTLLIYIDNKVDTEGEGGEVISGAQDQLQGLEITAFITVEAIQDPNE